MNGGVPEREGWGEEDGTYVHLASEVGVLKDNYGTWVALDLDDVEISPPFADPSGAMDWVDREYAANPRHALEW